MQRQNALTDRPEPGLHPGHPNAVYIGAVPIIVPRTSAPMNNRTTPPQRRPLSTKRQTAQYDMLGIHAASVNRIRRVFIITDPCHLVTYPAPFLPIPRFSSTSTPAELSI